MKIISFILTFFLLLSFPLSAFAQGIQPSLITPTLFCLGSCPTDIISPTQTNTNPSTNPVTAGPTATVSTAPSTTQISSTPPCTSVSIASVHTFKAHTKPNGAISQLINLLLQFILKLIEQLLGLHIQQPTTGTPQPTAVPASPVPSAPVPTANPCATQAPQPTTQPQPTQTQPTQSQPTQPQTQPTQMPNPTGTQNPTPIQTSSGLIVGLTANGSIQPSQFPVKYARVGPTNNLGLSAFKNAGIKIVKVFPGPANSNGVIGLGDPTTWANNSLAEYKSYGCDPVECPWVEILNEPALPDWGGTASKDTANAAAYAKLLKATYTAFKTAYGTSHPLILASFDGGWSTQTSWGQEWMAADPTVLNYVDGVVDHPYAHNNANLLTTGARQNVINTHNLSGKPVYITEVGWPTTAVTSYTAVTTAQQCNYIYNFVVWARSTSYVKLVTVYNETDIGSAGWGVFTSAGARRPSYSGLQAAANNQPNPCPAN